MLAWKWRLVNGFNFKASARSAAPLLVAIPAVSVGNNNGTSDGHVALPLRRWVPSMHRERDGSDGCLMMGKHSCPPLLRRSIPGLLQGGRLAPLRETPRASRSAPPMSSINNGAGFRSETIKKSHVHRLLFLLLWAQEEMGAEIWRLSARPLSQNRPRETSVPPPIDPMAGGGAPLGGRGWRFSTNTRSPVLLRRESCCSGASPGPNLAVFRNLQLFGHLSDAFRVFLNRNFNHFIHDSAQAR